MYQKQSYLETLRNVPDDVVVRAAGHTLDLQDPNRCICGWVLREAIATMRDVSVRNVNVLNGKGTVAEQCSRIFGGTAAEWEAIYSGVTNKEVAPAIEAAFYQRVRESY